MSLFLRNTLLISALLFSTLLTAAEKKLPPLPTEGFITGRIATQADVRNGNAAFASLPEQDVMRSAVPIPVPQYAYYRGKNKLVMAFVIQIERVNGKLTIGARLIESGEIVVGAPQDFQMLGVAPGAAQ